MPSVGDVVDGRYAIESLLGRGGMATVFRATDTMLGRTVAVKFFGASEAPGAAAERATSEVRLLASLNHPSLVTLFDARVDDADRTYLVMELVEGPTLQQLLDEGPVAPAAVATMVADLAEGLHVAHERGVVHRDVKPANVLLAPLPGPGVRYRAKLADFGIAYLVDSTRVTATGTLMGTAAFVSPEQAQGHPVGPPSDVYSLGLVALEALTGERAFGGTMVEQLTARLLRSPEIPGGVGAGWKALLTSMTATDPAARPDALEVARRAREVGDVPEDGGATALLDRPGPQDTATRVLPAGAAIAGGAAAGAAAAGLGASSADAATTAYPAGADAATTAYPTGAAPSPGADAPTERFGTTPTERFGTPLVGAGASGAGAGVGLAADRDAAPVAGGPDEPRRKGRAGLVVALVLVGLLLLGGIAWAVVSSQGDDSPAPVETTHVETTEPAPEVTSEAPAEPEPSQSETQAPAPTQQPAPPAVTPTTPPQDENEDEPDEDEQDEDESPVTPVQPSTPTTGNSGNGNGAGAGAPGNSGNPGGGRGNGPGAAVGTELGAEVTPPGRG